MPHWRGSGRNWTALPDIHEYPRPNAGLSMLDGIARAGTVGIVAGPGKTDMLRRNGKTKKTDKAPQLGTAQPHFHGCSSLYV